MFKGRQGADHLRLPNLIIPGAGKSGTSSLHEYLSFHPDIFMSDPKEPHFFSDDERYDKGIESYAALFRSSGTSKVRGESSTTYFHFPRAVERIQACLPDPRFIVTLRNPVDRIESHYRWLTSQGLETRPFREAVLADLDDEPDFRNSVGGNFRYYAAETRYAKHVGRFIDAFGRSSIFVITTEELRDSPADVLARCARFLSVKPFSPPREVWLNATVPPDTGVGRQRRGLRGMRNRRAGASSITRSRPVPRLSEEDRVWVRDLFVAEVAELRHRLQQRFGEWSADFPPAPAVASRH